MEVTRSPAAAHGYARFACDFCRQKKLKCSRELPKCGICKPWPGKCEYSRDMQNPSDLKGNQKSPVAEKNDIEDRLQSLEQTIQQLTSSVERALQNIAPDYPRTEDSPDLRLSRRVARSEKECPDSRLYIGSSHSFSFLKDTSTNLEIFQQPSNENARRNACSELQYLNTTLTTAQIHRNIVGDTSTSYYVPSRAAGYRLIGQFLENSEIGEPFFFVPSDEIISQVVFHPQKVKEKAWIIYFNYLLLCDIRTENPDTIEKEKFRHNVQLALNDSSIFLEPREANLQALVLLAVHGEDYAAPNLSWMLLGHACRQAEALGLHAPARHISESHNQRRLCLFWLLLAIDRSCSLAFGRPSFLSNSIYHDIPFPDENELLRFHPHDRPLIANQPASSHISTFGARLLIKSFEWARLIGDVLEFLSTKRKSSILRSEIRSRLEDWYLETEQTLLETMRVESAFLNAQQAREMRLGISSITFQYLHALILLLKGEEPCSELRLSSAREAISLLSSMVSNWSSVYNGVVWHLLYFPFTPFFVIFEHIIKNNYSTREVERDLALLSSTVTYFAEIQSEMRLLTMVCSRLQQVAAVFSQLAQIHASQNTRSRPENFRQIASLERNKQAEEPTHGSCAQVQEVIPDIDTGDLDFASYIEWLPNDMDAIWPMIDSERRNSASFRCTTGGNGTSTPRFQNRRNTFDGMFDWFSWDAYYAGNNK
ncbi:hypothetical protein BGW36DRAFT_389237 [Talaromyces proteolyticus]|uniref:Zn(2)-C6 fungal-type domain-containing protein n=1 Tax=Talaromyces proteolyticus TaxID=1131652 RepID=A0AAD4KF08_9EURO|nr:uncharacterized protein BGW36DRAFT_389237 [Talaromyces proteolyticus]KAH8690734.1 hypothetical protein BGW36DRAFT_389237 [Talaromyces proteolyticus]